MGGDRRGGRGQAHGPGARRAGPPDRRPGARAPGRVVPHLLAGHDRPVAAGLAQGPGWRHSSQRSARTPGWCAPTRSCSPRPRRCGWSCPAAPPRRSPRSCITGTGSPSRSGRSAASCAAPGCTARRWPPSRRPAAGMRPARRTSGGSPTCWSARGCPGRAGTARCGPGCSSSSMTIPGCWSTAGSTAGKTPGPARSCCAGRSPAAACPRFSMRTTGRRLPTPGWPAPAGCWASGWCTVSPTRRKGGGSRKGSTAISGRRSWPRPSTTASSRWTS